MHVKKDYYEASVPNDTWCEWTTKTCKNNKKRLLADMNYIQDKIKIKVRGLLFTVLYKET